MRETRQMYAPNIKRRRIFFYLVNSRNQICVPKLLCCTCIMSDGKGKSVYYYNLPVNKALQMLQIGWTLILCTFYYAKTRDKIMISKCISMCIITVIWIYMYQVYAFCCTGETDWKVLAIDVTDPLASDLNGTLFILRLIMFLKNYIVYCCMY